jgi:DNA-binding PadR family transcriptional regulator
MVTTLILQAIRDGHRHGADIMQATGQPAGTVYKVLRRLDDMGLLTAKWEQPAIAERERRPRRRYYRLTVDGERELVRAVERYRQLAPAALGRIVPQRSR